MKVGIVTLPLHTNYGGILQAWALQTVIERMGHESSHVFRHLLGPLCVYEGRTSEEIRTIQGNCDRFVDRYIRCDETPIAEIAPDRYDTLVVGSDQIWRHYIDGLLLVPFTTAFLDFAESWNVKRIAYAPSFGIDKWEAPEEMIPRCSELLKKFDAVSCRELSGAAICRDVLGVEAKTVVDPTLLMKREDYEALIAGEATEPPPGTLMSYVLDRNPEKQALIDAIAAAHGLEPYYANAKPEDNTAPLAERVQPPIEQWLRGFRDSKMVITDSFHATVFSILFGRPFIVTGNPWRGLSRLESLLKQLGLEDHLVMTAKDFDPKKDYGVPPSAYEKLDALRRDAMDFLKEALS